MINYKDMLSSPIIVEKDVVSGGYCIECFSLSGFGPLRFFNGHGPFCTKKCFANYIDVDVWDLPKMTNIGRIK